tara:strand:- start:540 stop:881 length:342 start_codon:yes stop_codon:yes gene_type:complete
MRDIRTEQTITFPVKTYTSGNHKGVHNVRNYFTKAHFETMRLALEKYVTEKGTVIREELLREGTPYDLTERQLGYIVSYSERRYSVLCSFIYKKDYYITTVETMKKLTGEKNG